MQERLEYLLGMMESEADILQVEKRIRGRVKKQMEKSQRNYYLSEQIKAIRKEMDEGESEDTIDEVEQLRQKVEAQVCQQMCVTKWKVSCKNSK